MSGRAFRGCLLISAMLVLPVPAMAGFCSDNSGSASSNDEEASCVIKALQQYGFYDGPMSMAITAGGETATFEASGVADMITKYNTLYPDSTTVNGVIVNPQGTTSLRKFTAKNFPAIFGQAGTDDLALNPALFANNQALNFVPFSATGKIDGLTLSLTSAANSNTFVLDVPEANIHQTFTGTSRYQALQNMTGWINGNANTLINDLHNAVASHTDLDPVIGNPQSFVQQLASATFDFGTSLGETNPGKAKNQAAPHLDTAFSMSMEPQYFEARGISGIAVHAPLDYTWFLDDPRYAITLDVPLNFVRQNSTDAINGAIGIGIRIPLLKNWYVTPQAHIGAMVSLDSGPFGIGNYGSAVYTLGVRSKYNIFAFNDTVQFSIINSFGYYESLDIDIGDYTLDPNIATRVYSNGIAAETASDMTLFGSPTSWRAYAQDHRISGTHSQVTGWEEFGVALGTTGRMTRQSWESLQIGVSAAVGDAAYRAIELNLTARF